MGTPLGPVVESKCIQKQSENDLKILPGGKLRGRCDALMINKTKTASETASNNILAQLVFGDRLTIVVSSSFSLYTHGW